MYLTFIFRLQVSTLIVDNSTSSEHLTTASLSHLRRILNILKYLWYNLTSIFKGEQ